jgi:hypothetical protein
MRNKIIGAMNRNGWELMTNIEHPTSNIELRPKKRKRTRMQEFDKGND